MPHVRLIQLKAYILVFVFFLVAGIVSIAILNISGPRYPSRTRHIIGYVTDVSDDSFEVETAKKQSMSFIEMPGTRVSVAHLKRHLNEHAPTDVYYLVASDGAYIVVNVD